MRSTARKDKVLQQVKGPGVVVPQRSLGGLVVTMFLSSRNPRMSLVGLSIAVWRKHELCLEKLGFRKSIISDPTLRPPTALVRYGKFRPAIRKWRWSLRKISLFSQKPLFQSARAQAWAGTIRAAAAQAKQVQFAANCRRIERAFLQPGQREWL
jgi:hypothetical protein